MLYFFDLNGLVEHLKKEQDTEYDSFRYTVATLLVGLVPYERILSGDMPKQDPTIWSLIAFLSISAVLGILLLGWYFKSNGGREGKHFLLRTLTLHWVLGWRFGTLALAGAGIAALISPTRVSALLGAGFVILASWPFYIYTIVTKLKEIHLATCGPLPIEVRGSTDFVDVDGTPETV